MNLLKQLAGRRVVASLSTGKDSVAMVAFWITAWPFPQYVKHAWPGAWICSAFRNDRPDLHLSSALIVEAIAGTRFYWTPPTEGMITFVDPAKTRRKRDPGRCFRRAGFHVSGSETTCVGCNGKPPATEGGLVALHMDAVSMPPPAQPIGAQTLLQGLL